MWWALVRGWRMDCVVGGMETRFQWRKAHSRTAKCEAFHVAPRLFFMFLFLIPFTIRQQCIIYPQDFSTEHLFLCVNRVERNWVEVGGYSAAGIPFHKVVPAFHFRVWENLLFMVLLFLLAVKVAICFFVWCKYNYIFCISKIKSPFFLKKYEKTFILTFWCYAKSIYRCSRIYWWAWLEGGVECERKG